MEKRSFMYKHPLLFETLLKAWHGDVWKRRYEFMAEQIGKGKTVLEPACGTAPLARFLDESCTYRGFDTNEIFLDYARKKGSDLDLVGFDVYTADARKPESYEIVDIVVDIVALCDSLHHLGLQNETQVLENCRKYAGEKIIICDPHKDRVPFQNTRLINELFNYTEKDGHNQVRLENIRTKNELLRDMGNGFGVRPKITVNEILGVNDELGEDLIAVYLL